MNSTPRVSVIIPTYNHLQFLPKAVETALNQTYDDYEVIVVDDGSTDDTLAWLNTIDDDRLQVISQENKGPAEAINTGVLAARGEYLTWMSADNFCADYFVEAFVAALDSDSDHAFAYSPYYVMDGSGTINSLFYMNVLLLRELVTRTGAHRGNAGFMYRKSVHDKVGMYDGWACDMKMWAGILENFSSVYVLEPTYYYRIHDEMATRTQKSTIDQEAPNIFLDFLKKYNGNIDQALLTRLYPMLAKSPQLTPQAITDFACRMFRAGAQNQALSYLKVVLSNFGVDDILKPLLNFIGLARVAGIDPMPHISEAIATSKVLDEAAKAAAMEAAGGLAKLYGFKTAPEVFMIDSETMPLKYEAPKLFSYTAWKAGDHGTPVPVL